MNILQQIAKLLGGKLTKVHEKTVANKEAIEDEVRRAQASETLLDTNIKNETKRAQDEEARIELKAVDLVTKEETRAIAAEKANSDAISSIDEAYKAADTSLSNRITAEANDRKAADTALDDKKVDKVEGKQLSTEDYTTAEKTKVGNLSSYVVDNIFRKNVGSSDLVLQYHTKDPVTGSLTERTTIVPVVSDTLCGVITPSQKLVLDNLISGDSALSILGTPSSTWQLNLGSGPKIKNSGGIFELRNAADTAYTDLTVNALTIKGNVTQEGGSFITQAETVSAKDNTILLNSGETGAGVTKGTAGIEIDRGTLPKYKFIFDESDDRFKVGSEGDLWSVMLRDNESDLTNGGILTWDASTKRAKTAFNIDDLADTYLPLAGGIMTGPIYIAPLTEGVNNGIQASPGTWSGDNSLLTYDASVVDFGPSNALLNIWGTEIAFNPTTATDIVFSTAGSNNLVHKIQRKKYLIYDEHNLDISQFAKAADYIPLAGNSTGTPITGHLYTKDVFGWGLYGMKIEGADDIPRTTHIQFNANQTGAMGSEPAKSNAYTEMGSTGEEFFPNSVSQLRVGYEDNLPVLKYRTNPEGVTKEYNIYHEGNLDVNSMVSGFLPLSAGMDKPLTGVLYASSLGGAGRGINIMGGTVTSSDSGIEFISKDGVMGMGMVSREGASIWVGTSQDDTHICATIDNSDRWTFPNGVYFRGSEGATLEDLSGYLPITGGNNNPIRGSLAVKGAINISNSNTGHFPCSLIYNNASGVNEFNINCGYGDNGSVINFTSLNGLFYRQVEGSSQKFKIWHENNDGVGSGLDADLLDGKQGSEYALASSLGSYLPLSGGTVTGDINLSSSKLVQVQNILSHYSSVVSWAPGNVLDGSNIGRHNAGGDGTGAIVLVPYATDKNSWERQVGLYIGKNELLLDGKPVALKENIPSVPSYIMTYHGAQANVNTSRGTGAYSFHSVVPGVPDGYAYGSYLQWGNDYDLIPGTSNHWINQLAGTTEDLLYYRTRTNDGAWTGWKRIAYASEIPTSMAWGSVTGKPSFATVATSGSYNDLSNKPSIPSVLSSLKNPYAITFTGAVTGTYDGSAAKTVNIPTVPSLSGGAGATSGQYVSGVTVSGHSVTVTKASLPTSLPANGGYANELRGTYYASGGPEKPTFFNKAGLFLRMLGSGNLGVTNTYMDTLIINTYIYDVPWCNALAFAKDGTARGWIVAQNPNNADWGTKKQIVTSDMLPTSLPASDVYSWAKASTKPSYAWSEITGRPTIPSLSGYATQSWVQSQGYKTTDNNYYPTAVSWTTAKAEGPNIRISGTGMSTINAVIPSASDTQSGTVHCGAQTFAGAKTFTAFVTCSAGAGTSSDIRLKKHINRMFDAEEVLSNLSGYRYVMKETDMHYAGLIAQEVQEVLPEAVREDENGFLTVDTYPIVAALVEANKAKDNRIKSLEDRITALEKKMNMILNKLG